jgi:hypothetical protein
MIHDLTPAISRAQASFDNACGDLDAAVRSLGAVDGDTVMANADLVALLLRVSAARRRLEDLRRPRTTSPPASLR